MVKTGEAKVIYEMSEENLRGLIADMRVQVREEIASTMKLATEKPLVTVKCAAVFLGVSGTTVKKLMREGGLPHHIVGGSYLFFPSELVSYVKSRKKK